MYESKFFRSFAKRHAHMLKKGGASNMDSKRAGPQEGAPEEEGPPESAPPVASAQSSEDKAREEDRHDDSPPTDASFEL